MGKGFKELSVWQKARDLAIYIYQITKQGPLKNDYGLSDQMRKSAVSVPSNIAEGDELDTTKQAIKFFYTAKGSSAEVMTQAIIAYEIGYITREHFDDIKKECRAIYGMLMKLIQARKK